MWSGAVAVGSTQARDSRDVRRPRAGARVARGLPRAVSARAVRGRHRGSRRESGRRRSGSRRCGSPRSVTSACSRPARPRARPTSRTPRSPTSSAPRSTRREARCPPSRSGRSPRRSCAPSRAPAPTAGSRARPSSACSPRSPNGSRCWWPSTTCSGSIPPAEQALTFAFRRLPPRLGLLLARRASRRRASARAVAGAPRRAPRADRAPAPLARRAVPAREEPPRPVAPAAGADPPRRGDGRQPVLRARAGACVREPARRARPRPAAAGPAERRRGRRRPAPARCPTRRARSALAAASTSHPTPAPLAGALGEETMSAGLIEAEEAGVLTVEDNRTPLLASAARLGDLPLRVARAPPAAPPPPRNRRHGHRAAGAPPGAQHDGGGSVDRGRARGSRPRRQHAEARNAPPPSCSPRRSG